MSTASLSADNLEQFLSPATTLLGVVVAAMLVIRQISLQRRLSYITTLLSDPEVMEWYKIFLKDLRFLYEFLGVFPQFEVNQTTVEAALSQKESCLSLEYLATYIRHVLRGSTRLKKKYAHLASQTDAEYEPCKVFSANLYPDISRFSKSIMYSLTFHPARAWFVSLFSPTQRKRQRIEMRLHLFVWQQDRAILLQIEKDVRQFVIGRWS